MMATDELRKMLDERGVEWLNSDGDCCDSDDDYMLAEQDSRKTTWSVDIAGDDMTITAHEVYENDELEPWFDLEFHEYFAPEQAIAATLGSEFNPDGLPVGLTISDDSNLLNWRGENYVKQSTFLELIANRDESIHNLVKLLDKRQERIKALESLVRDMRNLMATPAWDRGGWSTDGKCVEFDTRMAELGLEVDA